MDTWPQKKVCSRWIPHNLTVAQKKKARLDRCKEILKKYNRGVSKDVYKIVTGDESWIYAYEPETKQKKNEKKMLLKRSKTMFWRCLNRSGKSASTIGLSACKSA